MGSNRQSMYGSCGSRCGAGFTLIELLVVIVIIGVLAGLTINISAGARARAATDKARAELAVLAAALESYHASRGQYPQTTSGASLLDALVGPGTPRPFITVAAFTLSENETHIVDPWGNAYVYAPFVSGSRRGFHLHSLGPDGAAGGEKDLDNISANP